MAVYKLTQNNIMSIPDIFWLPLPRLPKGYQLIWVEDTADMSSVVAELVTDDYQSAINSAMTNYLKNSDWIVSKIAEASALGNDITVLLDKYSVELQRREIVRANII